ncbi:hypothetical protein ACJ73_03927, partial [Blastomyces percursus]
MSALYSLSFPYPLRIVTTIQPPIRALHSIPNTTCRPQAAITNIDTAHVKLSSETDTWSISSSSRSRSNRRSGIATARPTKSARVVDADGIVEGVFRRADVSISAPLERAPTSVAAVVDVEGFAAHGWWGFSGA